MAHMYDAVLLSHEKNGILPFVMSWMGLENIMLSERSQMENVKNRIISLMQDIKLKATKTNTHRRKQQDGAYQGHKGVRYTW